MPTIDPSLVPTVSPGNIFSEFTKDNGTLNVRYLAPLEPAYWEILNRPTVDVVVRQLVIAKALDSLQMRLGHSALFPFLIAPRVVIGTGTVVLPETWIWDMHVSLPAKWEHLRLAKLMRLSGQNDGVDTTGIIRLVFTAQQGSGTEVALFTVDYQIDDNLSYQISRIVIATADDDSNPLDSAESETINGFVIMRTLDLTNSANLEFVTNSIAPPSNITDSNSDGFFDIPATYEISTSDAGGSGTDDFLSVSLSHGTGILVISAWNAIPALDSDFSSWLKSSNYPFGSGASRTSVDGIVIPQALFNEFNVVVPTPDDATGVTGNSPVWLSSIERVDSLANTLKFVFSTNDLVNSTATEVEFCSLTLKRDYLPGRAVNIVPSDDLLGQEGTDQTTFRQGFGSGSVLLGGVWGASTTDISDFFDSFLSLITTNVTVFTAVAGRIGSFGVSRVPATVPTQGQFDALKGTTGRLSNPKNPSDDNRFILEADQGLGEAVDFREQSGFTENADIENVGYTGSLAHKIVRLDVDSAGDSHDYDADILPRLKILFGRDPIFADEWFDGISFRRFNGETWISN